MLPAPTVFTLETFLGCNLKCPECATGGRLINRKSGRLSMDSFNTILEKVRPHAQYLYLHLWGEPLLNRDIFEMIGAASKVCPTNISTNGVFEDLTIADRLIDSGVRDIIISIDGVTQQVYERYRVGGDVNQALAFLHRLAQRRAQTQRQVNIMPQFVVFKHNQHEAQHFLDFCQRLGLHPTFKDPYIREGSELEWSDIPSMRRPTYPDVETLQAAMTECGSVKNDFTILLDGSVVVCCHDYDGQTAFGNIFEEDVLEIWNKPDFVDYRQAVTAGSAPRFCIDNCVSYFLAK